MAYSDKNAKGADSSAKAKDDKLKLIRERFKLCQETEAKQRDREGKVLRFQVPELQWEDQDRIARKGRPTLSISKLDQPRQLILNQMRNADLGIEVHPISEDAVDDTAEMIQGLYRHIERKSRAELARFWAYDRAVTAGRGAYRVLTEYDDEGGAPSDQRIVIQRILHQEGVYFDPAAQEPDYSDGHYAFVVQWMTKKEFQHKYPNAKKTPSNAMQWATLEREAPEWVRKDDVLVAEYWYKEFATKKVDGYEDRERDIVTVAVCVVSGAEILDEESWPGKWIPLIPTLGREIQPFDEERRWVGMMEAAMDGQKLYNHAASSLVEGMSLEPKAPYVAAAEAIEGYEDFWRTANTQNHPVLYYNAFLKGNPNAPLPPPARSQVDSTRMQLSMMALQEADQFIQATTAVFDPSLGKMPQKERSGKAIMALQQQADAGTSHFLQNLADISMTYEAKVVLDLIPKIYERPGRITRIVMGDDRKSKPVMLGVPFVQDPQSQRPMQAPANAQEAKTYDLTKGVYAVSVSIGKSFQTRLQEGSEKIGEMLSQNPELFMMLGDLFLNFQDWPGAKEMSKRMAKVREKQFPGLGEGEDGQVPPEQMQAQLQGAKQQLQQMEQVVQQLTQALETEQAKQQAILQKADMDSKAKLQQTDMDNQADLRRSEMDNAMKLQIAELQAQVDMAIAQLKAQMDQYKVAAGGMQAERSQAAEGQQKELELAIGGQQKERELAIGGEQREREMALNSGEQERAAERTERESERQREHEQKMPVIQAKVAPKPEPKK
jgi:portal protein